MRREYNVDGTSTEWDKIRVGLTGFKHEFQATLAKAQPINRCPAGN